jgi:hypothetical protein
LAGAGEENPIVLAVRAAIREEMREPLQRIIQILEERLPRRNEPAPAPRPKRARRAGK